ncbi:hypothetical protein UB35_07005 [Photobacterium angustum]|nr:hypothetical protein UB35_07005 [Photobacterium angustum]PSV68422.1 hypothetical protein CTM95_03590 [Photobacterium angustum]
MSLIFNQYPTKETRFLFVSGVKNQIRSTSQLKVLRFWLIFGSNNWFLFVNAVFGAFIVLIFGFYDCLFFLFLVFLMSFITSKRDFDF